MNRLGDQLPESSMSMLLDFSVPSMESLSPPLREMWLGQQRIVFHELKGLPPQTGYLLCSGVCYELALSGDGLRIVRQFPWPESKPLIHILSPQSSSSDLWQNFLSTYGLR